MARPFAKLAVGSGADEKLGMIAERDGLGGMLFLLSIPEAYPYGILPGSPRAYRAQVIPAALVAEQEIQEAIDAQVEVGLLHRYEVGDKQYLYLRNYHRYQDVAWSRVRPSDYPLPSCWEVPDDLQAIIEDEEALANAKKRFGAYGIMGLSAATAEASAQVPLDAPEVPTECPQGASEKERHRGGTSTATATATATSSEGSDGTHSSDVPSIEDQLGDLRADVPTEELALIDEYLDHAAAENKSGTITLGRRVNETRDLLDLRETLGEGPWRYGMSAANRKSAPNLNYVKKAAGSWKPKTARASPVGDGHLDDLPETTTVGWD